MASLLFLFPNTTQGAFSNFNSTLIGEQASGMGGAYTAMWGDSSSSGFYNPASLVRLEGTDISASATLFNKYDTTYGEGKNLVDAGERVNRGFFRTIPSAIGNAYRWKDWAFGFNIVVPDYDFFAGNIADGDSEQSFLSYTDESLWSGIVSSYKLNDNQSIGVTLYYTARSLIRYSQDRSVVSSTHEVITTEEKSLKQNSLVAVIGYLANLNKKWTLGFSVRPPAASLSGDGSFYRATTDTAALPSVVEKDRTARAQTFIPPRYTLGLSFRPNPRLILSMDTSYYSGYRYQDLGASAGSDLIRHKETWNLSFGSEYKLKWPKVNWRMGLFTNNSSISTPEDNPSQRQSDSMDLWGFSSNFNFKVSEQSSYTIGGFYTGGDGKSVQRTGNQLRVMDKNHHIFSLLISTSYQF